MKSKLEKTFEKVEKKKDAPAKPRKKRSAPRIATIIGMGVGLIIGINVAFVLRGSLIEESEHALLKSLAVEHVNQMAANVERYVAELQAQLHAQADRATLLTALTIDDPVAIDKVNSSIVSAFTHAEALQIIRQGSATLDEKTSPPIRFTELEMIRRAENRESVLAEAAKSENHWSLKLITPTPRASDQDVLATLLLTLSLDGLKAAATDNKISIGRTEFVQQIGSGRPVSLFELGQEGPVEAVTKAIPNTYWSIHFSPSHAIAVGLEESRIQSYAIIVGAVLGLVLMGFVGGQVAGIFIERKLRERKAVAMAARGAREADLLSEGEVPRELVNPLYQKADILDVELSEEDEDLLGLGDVGEVVQKPVKVQKAEEDILDIAEDDASIPDVIFRSYDIRGLAHKEITPELARLIGRALGSEAIDGGQETLIVARDGRLSSPELAEALIAGIVSTGCNVLNIGLVPTPVLYFATATLKESQSGVMVTASHNPGDYNGFKVVMNGKARSDDDIKAIRRRILRKDLYDGQGEEQSHDIVSDYIDTIFSDVALAGDVSIVIDAGNGVTGEVAPALFEALGCQVIPLFCEVDGRFPNHSPDPSIVDNLQPLIDKVRESQADLGVAFDGDGDRVIVVTSTGQVIWPDQLLMMFAKDIVSRNPGTDVVFDVKSTKHLASCITSYGGRPIMWKTGHAPMKNKMIETNAVLGGEYSGHIFIKDRWFGFDDGMYAAARLIEILSLQGQTLDEMFDEFPRSPATPEIRVAVSEEEKFRIVDRLAAEGNFADGRITNIDGVRVDFSYGWGLVRASNTSANLTLRFEANDEASLAKVKHIVAAELKRIAKSIDTSWNV